MTKEVISKLGHNLLMELKRKDYTKEERKEIIECFQKETGLSLRQISVKYQIPHTTIFYWIHPDRKLEEQQRSFKITKGNLMKQLLEIDKKTSEYVEKIDNRSLKVNDDCRDKIEEIKDRWNYIYMKTRRVVIK